MRRSSLRCISLTATSPNCQSEPVDQRAGYRHPPVSLCFEIAASSGGFVSIPPADRRRKNRNGAIARAIFVRQREVSDPLRHVGVYGEAFRIEAHRLAAGLCWLRGRRTAYGTREAESVFGHFAR